MASALDNLLAREKESGLNLDDAVKLLGCWDALADPEGVLSKHNVTGDRHNSLMRAITFTNTIKASKLVRDLLGRSSERQCAGARTGNISLASCR